MVRRLRRRLRHGPTTCSAISQYFWRITVEAQIDTKLSAADLEERWDAIHRTNPGVLPILDVQRLVRSCGLMSSRSRGPAGRMTGRLTRPARSWATWALAYGIGKAYLNRGVGRATPWPG